MFANKFSGAVFLLGVLFSQSIPQVTTAAYCDQAQFISDVSVPDGAAFAPGTAFIKTWRLQNVGSCTWTTAYRLAFISGDGMGAPAAVSMPVVVPPGEMVDVSVNLTAPAAPGHYRGLWKLRNAAGTAFGIGATAADAFWVDINVIDGSAVIFDFVANAPYAQWKSGAGPLPYPGTSGDNRGYAYKLDAPRLENDSVDTLPGLLTVPHNKWDGYIQATYPELQVEAGDRLQTLVNCEFGATRCYVTFRVDYITESGSVRTLWTWREAYEGKFYRASIDLSPLAGQRVRFILMVLSNGSASWDRPIWGSPRIVRSATGSPPAPPATLTPLPAFTPTVAPLNPPPSIAPSGCDKASFVADINVPDGTVFAPGAAFTKTWRLKNAGSCAWTTAYRLLFYSGEQMGAPTSLNLPRVVMPGDFIDLTVNMIAPALIGSYRGFWILSNSSGALFGLGSDATMPFWVEILVAGQSPTDMGYDFTSNVCAAQWRSGAGTLPCPGLDGDANGFVLRLDAPLQEDGSTSGPGLITFPQRIYNGYIQGIYPTFTVQPGDRFQTTVGCEFGSYCGVAFRLDYMTTATGSVNNFVTWREQNERHYSNLNVDLTPLAGRSVRFVLTILALGTSNGDRALWGAPRIVHAVVSNPITATASATSTATETPSPTLTPTATSTVSTENWLTYTDAIHGFEFKYPPGGQIVPGVDNVPRISLPIQPGTNLVEKYLEVFATENSTTCHSPLTTPNPPETVIINGISFLKETATEGAAGSLYQWVAYSTARDTVCVTLSFVLHSHDPSMFSTPPPVFDRAAETAVFGQIVSTFTWLAPTPTPTPTSITADWLAYTNSYYGFQLRYPPRLEDIPSPDNNYARIDLSFQGGTNLREKYLEVIVVENANPCQSPLATSSMLATSETVTINGISFLKQTGGDAGAGNFYQWEAYSTASGSACVSLDFVLHSLNPDNFATPPLVFDYATETAVFLQIVETFTWLPATPTPEATLTPTATPDLTGFEQALVAALNAQDFAALRTSMEPAFAFGFWQSQGFSTTPDLAIQQLSANYIGPNTHLTPDPAKDLTALLGGLNAYAIMGIDPATSHALFVSGWGLEATSEAILYTTRRPDGSLYWNAVLIAPAGF